MGSTLTSVLAPILKGLVLLCDVLSVIICVNSVMSIISPMGKLREFTSTLCEPLLAPFRNLMDKLVKNNTPFDFSPMMAILALYALSALFSVWMARL